MNKGEKIGQKKEETFKQFDTEEEVEEYFKKELANCDILKLIKDTRKAIQNYQKTLEN